MEKQLIPGALGIILDFIYVVRLDHSLHYWTKCSRSFFCSFSKWSPPYLLKEWAMEVPFNNSYKRSGCPTRWPCKGFQNTGGGLQQLVLLLFSVRFAEDCVLSDVLYSRLIEVVRQSQFSGFIRPLQADCSGSSLITDTFKTSLEDMWHVVFYLFL